MEFEFTGTLWVEESSLERMKERVCEGEELNEVYEDWANGLDDADYYVVDYVKEDILKEILKRAL